MPREGCGKSANEGTSGRSRLRSLLRLSLAALAGVALLELGAVFSLVQPALRSREHLAERDLIATLTAAHIVARGEGGHLYDPRRQQEMQAQLSGLAGSGRKFLPFVHPPFVLLPALPLTRVAPSIAYLIYIGVSAGVVIFILGIIARQAGLRGALPLLALVTYFPVLVMLQQGQNSFLPLAGIGLARGAFVRGRDWTGGAWLALVAAKPQYSPLFPLVLAGRGRWRALFGLALASLGLYLAGAALAGLDWPFTYLKMICTEALAGEERGVHPIAMHNLRGLLHAAWPGINPGLALSVSGALAVAGFFAVYRRWPPGWAVGERSWELAWALSAVMALLASPHVNTHDLVLLLVPGVLVAANCLADSGGFFWLALLWFCYLASPLTLLLIVHHRLLRFTVFSTLALGAALWWQLKKSA